MTKEKGWDIITDPMHYLRKKRDQLLIQTDQWALRSIDGIPLSQKQKDYRQALRDLPANYSPTFDILTEDNYPLVKEDNTTPWPEEPIDG